ncbi:MAG: haloacid dehalogenase type II [Betaproteobacteria bacterium]|nr:haloacid dehalogenase type II [Betaproteobacteria bacterium]
MNPTRIKALTFDTGGTILDWHTGVRTALLNLGTKYGLRKDWAAIANEFRRRSLKGILNHGEHGPATKNLDDVHRATVDQLAAEMGLGMFTEEDRRTIWWDTIHNLECWPDFPAVLPKLREKFYCVSFTLLSFRIIMDTAKRNGLSWDAVMSCEGIGKYKLLPEAYLTCAKFLQFDQGQCLMVACHNFDLDAARACGYKTAFVYRPDEWGAQGPPDPEPKPYFDIVAADFPDLARQLGVRV